MSCFFSELWYVIRAVGVPTVGRKAFEVILFVQLFSVDNNDSLSLQSVVCTNVTSSSTLSRSR